jgi:hypothetical protein
MRLDGLLNTNEKATGKQGYRSKAGHSLHDMKIAAGVRCDCAKCKRARAVKETMAEAVPQLALKAEHPD